MIVNLVWNKFKSNKSNKRVVTGRNARLRIDQIRTYTKELLIEIENQLDKMTENI